MKSKQKTKDKASENTLENTIDDMFPLLKKPFKIQKDTSYKLYLKKK